MPNSVRKSLERFQHSVPKCPQHSPHKWLAPTYGAKVQYSLNSPTASKLEKCGITRMQSITGMCLYISRTVYPTTIVVLNEIDSEKDSPTTNTIKKKKILMEYAATQPDAVIRFHASDMCLHIDSDAAYLVHPK